MINTDYVLTFAAGLVVGALFGAAGMWAAAKPLIDVAQMERDNARLEARATRLEFHSN